MLSTHLPPFPSRSGALVWGKSVGRWVLLPLPSNGNLMVLALPLLPSNRFPSHICTSWRHVRLPLPVSQDACFLSEGLARPNVVQVCPTFRLVTLLLSIRSTLVGNDSRNIWWSRSISSSSGNPRNTNVVFGLRVEAEENRQWLTLGNTHLYRTKLSSEEWFYFVRDLGRSSTRSNPQAHLL